MPQSDYPILGAEIARARKRFQHPLLTSKPVTMTQSAQTTIPPYQHKGIELQQDEMVSYIYKFSSKCHVRIPYLQSRDSQAQETFLAPSADKQTCNYDTRMLKPPSLPINPKVKGIEPQQDEMVSHIFKFSRGSSFWKKIPSQLEEGHNMVNEGLHKNLST